MKLPGTNYPYGVGWHDQSDISLTVYRQDSVGGRRRFPKR